jgi:ubiquinone/menaquinone biosynthesis C-methylase UbiE
MQKTEYNAMYDLEDSHFWFVGKRYFIDAYLEKVATKRLKILDIGSGTGGLTKYIERYGKVKGLERDKIACEYCVIRKIDVVRGSAEKLPFRNKSFDLVTIFDVLYHRNVKDLDKAIKEVNRVLRRNGYLLITDSALNILTSEHDTAMQGKRRFNLTNMKQLFINNNFKIIKSSYIYFSLFPFIAFKRLIVNKISGHKNQSDVYKINSFINSILLAIISLEASLLKYVSYPIGSSLIILAQKKQ